MSIIEKTIRGTLNTLAKMPDSLLNRLAGNPPEISGAKPDPEIAFVLGLGKLLNSNEDHSEIDLAEFRAETDDKAIIFGDPTPAPRETSLTIPTENGPLEARRYDPHPHKPGKAVLLYLHGGGFTVGSLTSSRSIARYFARHADITVVDLAYRLAPENPFPAAPEDCLNAYRWLHHNISSWGIDPAAIMVGGDSAGANLSAVTALQIRNRRRAGTENLPQPRLQVLFYPVTDFTRSWPSYEHFRSGMMLTTHEIHWYADQYFTGGGDRAHEYASIVNVEDLSDLGPSYVGIAGNDPLRDEGLAYAEKITAAGNEVTTDLFRGLIHGYANASGVGTSCRKALNKAVEAVNAKL